MQEEELFALMFVAGMFVGVFVIFMAMRQRSQLLEMKHREKMAMIERGLAIPTQGPAVFRDRPSHTGTGRSMSVGIVLIGIGFGFMSLVGIAGGAPEAGVGVGGAVCIIGVAFIVNSLISRPDSQLPVYEPRPQDPRDPPPPPVPPL